ncbi:MAG TPA: glycosyltransferase family 1 protein [Candidatus Elarobacter sp.]|nr:glycosyltransferase family 1 protein [Candidatus Elarobacter sp.]
MSTVHVAVDAHNLARDDRGIGRYARAVLSRAVRDPGFRWTLVVRDLFPQRAAVARTIGAEPGEVAVARHVPRDADAVWFPWNGTFLRTDVPSVATVHDAAPFAYPAADPRRRATEQNPFLATANTARRILVQSRFTAQEVERRLGVDAARIVVTPLAADPVFTPRASADSVPHALRGKRYVLHVGAHDERKNTATLIAGFERAFGDAEGADAGGEPVLAFTRKPPAMPRRAVVVDASDDAALAALYRGAALVAVPSTYEGFGFPLLEAMACGAPSLAARAGALPEVGGDAAAYVDEPLDAGAWAQALRSLLGDDAARASLAARGPVRAAEFSWERCTAQTLGVLREVAALP